MYMTFPLPVPVAFLYSPLSRRETILRDMLRGGYFRVFVSRKYVLGNHAFQQSDLHLLHDVLVILRLVQVFLLVFEIVQLAGVLGCTIGSGKISLRL